MLTETVPRQLSRKEYVLPLAVGFFDESTDADIERMSYTVAGFASDNNTSACMELNWNDVLRHYDVKYFKASELNALEGQFRKFRDEPECFAEHLFSEREKSILKEIKTAFTDIIVKYSGSINALGAVVLLPDYERFKAESAGARKHLPDPYYIAAQWTMIEAGLNIAHQNETATDGQVWWFRPVFDSNEDYSGRMKQGFDYFRRNNPISSKFMLPPHYEDDKVYLALQVADNIAFEVRKYVWSVMAKRNQRTAIVRLMDAGCFTKIINLNYAGLKAIVEDAESPSSEPYTLNDLLRKHGPVTSSPA